MAILMILMIQFPPEPKQFYYAVVADRAACVAEANRIRDLERWKAAEGRFVTWVECPPR